MSIGNGAADRRYRRVGVLGGMGPLATQAFYGELIRATEAESDQDHIPVVVDADPSISDRTAFLLGAGADPRPAIMAAARRLELAGAELLVMPCNTAHAFEDELRQTIAVPLVPWVDTVSDAIAGHGSAPVAILATTGTLRAAMYQRALAQRDVATLVPGDREQEQVMSVVYGVKRGEFGVRLRQRLLEVAETMAGAGARSLLLACTELPLAVPASDGRWPVAVWDPAPLVARRVVVEAGGRLRRL
jgi:aspartate racemase